MLQGKEAQAELKKTSRKKEEEKKEERQSRRRARKIHNDDAEHDVGEKRSENKPRTGVEKAREKREIERERGRQVGGGVQHARNGGECDRKGCEKSLLKSV